MDDRRDEKRGRMATPNPLRMALLAYLEAEDMRKFVRDAEQEKLCEALWAVFEMELEARFDPSRKA
jgi:hypothetical protein